MYISANQNRSLCQQALVKVSKLESATWARSQNATGTCNRDFFTKVTEKLQVNQQNISEDNSDSE